LNPLRNVNTWIKKREAVLIEFCGVFSGIIIATMALLLYIFGLLDPLTLLRMLLGLLTAFLPIYTYLIKKKDQLLLISFILQYLLGEEEIDDLLGVLISEKWEKLKIDPIKEFFDRIGRMCEESNVEMRRRIAETLPALFKIDLERSKEIVKILRRDWDERFKSDNRRRAIESLPYIVKRDKDFVKECLQIIDGDEVFVIIAIVEVLDVWRWKINKKEAKELYENLMREIRIREYKDDEIVALSELWNLLYTIHEDPAKAIKRIDQLKDIPNIYTQVCIARNLYLLGRKFPEEVLELMVHFTQENKNKYVRRAIAKENSVEFIMSLFRNKKLSEKSKNMMLKLINDKDGTIRLAAFDKIEKILDIDRKFGESILRDIISKNQHPELIRRTERLLKRLSRQQ